MIETKVQNNKFWLGAIQSSLMLGTGLDDLTKEGFIDKISSEEIRRVAGQYFNTDDYLQVVLYPENVTAGN